MALHYLRQRRRNRPQRCQRIYPFWHKYRLAAEKHHQGMLHTNKWHQNLVEVDFLNIEECNGQV